MLAHAPSSHLEVIGVFLEAHLMHFNWDSDGKKLQLRAREVGTRSAGCHVLPKFTGSADSRIGVGHHYCKQQ